MLQSLDVYLVLHRNLPDRFIRFCNYRTQHIISAPDFLRIHNLIVKGRHIAFALLVIHNPGKRKLVLHNFAAHHIHILFLVRL